MISAVEFITVSETKIYENADKKTVAERTFKTSQTPFDNEINLLSKIDSPSEIKNRKINEVKSITTPALKATKIKYKTKSNPNEFLTIIAEEIRVSSPPLIKLPTIGIIEPVAYLKILKDNPLYWALTTPWVVKTIENTIVIIPINHLISDKNVLHKLLSFILGDKLLTKTQTKQVEIIGINKLENKTELKNEETAVIGLYNFAPNPPQNSPKVISSGKAHCAVLVILKTDVVAPSITLEIT